MQVTTNHDCSTYERILAAPASEYTFSGAVDVPEVEEKKHEVGWHPPCLCVPRIPVESLLKPTAAAERPPVGAAVSNQSQTYFRLWSKSCYAM